MSLTSVKGSKRLLAVTQAVDPKYLEELNQIDWFLRPWRKDFNYDNNWSFRRRVLLDRCDLMQSIDQDILGLITDINRWCDTTYRTGGSVWHLCEGNFVCPMHTDGHKPNVMIIYWQTPGSKFGTTFYNSSDVTDVFHEFAGDPNTGFFANYEPAVGEPWPEMWHASLAQVPADSYRLMSQYEFQR